MRQTESREGKGSFSRVYIDRDKAEKFADRQKKSPQVKSVTVKPVS